MSSISYLVTATVPFRGRLLCTCRLQETNSFGDILKGFPVLTGRQRGFGYIEMDGDKHVASYFLPCGIGRAELLTGPLDGVELKDFNVVVTKDPVEVEDLRKRTEAALVRSQELALSLRT